MKHSIKINTFTNNLSLKIIAVILGYTFWAIISTRQTTERWIEVPLCFFSVPDTLRIEAPEAVNIAFSGSRIDLANLDITQLAIHIDSRDLTPGNQNISLSEEQLLLPSCVKITHWSPSNLIIMVEEKRSNNERTA